MEELIDQYAGMLREIYEKQTAGDYTFEGVLYEFALKVTGEIIRQNKINTPTTVQYG